MLLGIDLGTSSVKALLLDESGQVHGRSSGRYRVLSPRADWVESEPREWLQAVRDAVQEAVGSRSRDVRAVGLSGQMHGVVLCDDYGTPLRPAILWADTRSGDELGTYRALGPEARSVLANPYVTGMAGPSLLWLRRHELDAYDKARWALQPKDWLRMQLTGQAGAEPSDASATLLYNIPEDRWAWEVAETLGLRHDLLAPLAPSSSRAGELLPGVATAWGLPAGIPVAMGAGDTPSAMLGTGLVHEGVMQLVLGTGAQLIVQRNEPVPDPSGRTHLYRAVGERRWYAMAAMQNAGLALDWVRRILGIEWREAYEEAFTAPPGAEGLLFLPQLTGERTPYLDSSMRGAWIGLHLHHERRHLLRAAFEGVAFALRDGLEALRTLGPTPDELRLAGGGAVDPRWQTILASVLALPLSIVAEPDASAVGAALLAGIAAGIFRDERDAAQLVPEPQPAAHPSPQLWARYDELYTRYRQQVETRQSLPTGTGPFI